jgi:hypothetical protein
LPGIIKEHAMQLETPSKATTSGDEPKRRHPRTIFSVPLTLRHLMAGEMQISPGVTLDLSEGGLGAMVQGSLRVGETVEVDLRLPGRNLRAVAIVRYVSSERSGFELLGLTADERVRITTVAGNA